jgi:hypothetical protein
VSFALDNEDVGLYVAGNNQIYKAAGLTSTIRPGMFRKQDTAPSPALCAPHNLLDGHLKWKSRAIDCLDDVYLLGLHDDGILLTGQ